VRSCEPSDAFQGVFDCFSVIVRGTRYLPPTAGPHAVCNWFAGRRCWGRSLVAPHCHHQVRERGLGGLLEGASTRALVRVGHTGGLGGLLRAKSG
jgi:hypothetical protein